LVVDHAVDVVDVDGAFVVDGTLVDKYIVGGDGSGEIVVDDAAGFVDEGTDPVAGNGSTITIVKYCIAARVGE